jgi:tRNA (guanine-N7-)-methyltransferase
MQPLFIPTDYFRELRRDEIFAGASRPLEVELGSGDATFLVAMAHQFPDRDFLGVERMFGRVEKTMRKITRRKLTNAKVMRLESAYTCAWLLPAGSVSRLHLLCPDPWPKKKHHRHRLVNSAEFLDGLTRVLQPGGEFLLKTDHEEYFQDALLSLASRPVFQRLDWPDDAFFYPTTDFEKQWLSQGCTIHRARWRHMASSKVSYNR